MATYAEIQTRVERRVIDLPSAVQAEIPTLVNEALREIQTKHNFKVMEEEASYTTTISVRAIGAVPTDYKEPRRKPYEQLDDGSVRQLWLGPDLETVNRYWEDDDEGYPNIIFDPEPDTDNVRQFQVWPLPDGNSDYDDGEYRINVPYWKYLAALSADGDSNWFTVKAEEYLVYKATSEAFAIDWDEERSLFWAQKAAGELMKVTKSDKLFRFAAVETLVPYKGVRDIKIEA